MTTTKLSKISRRIYDMSVGFTKVRKYIFSCVRSITIYSLSVAVEVTFI